MMTIHLKTAGRLKIDLFSSQLHNEKKAGHIIRKHPKSIGHALKLAKEEEKDLLVIKGLSKGFNHSINEISDITSLKGGCIYNSKAHNTVDRRLHIQGSKPQIKIYTY